MRTNKKRSMSLNVNKEHLKYGDEQSVRPESPVLENS
jgi:hypothetical protein